MSNTTSPITTPATAPGLTFEAALIAVKTGRKIRRTSWPIGQYMIFEPKHQWPGDAKPLGTFIRYMTNGDQANMIPHTRDILAIDWEIIE